MNRKSLYDPIKGIGTKEYSEALIKLLEKMGVTGLKPYKRMFVRSIQATMSETEGGKV